MHIRKIGHYIIINIMVYLLNNNHGKEIKYKKMNKKIFKDIDICYYVK